MFAETNLQLSGVRDEDRALLGALAFETDVLADRLVKIGSRTDRSTSS